MKRRKANKRFPVIRIVLLLTLITLLINVGLMWQPSIRVLEINYTDGNAWVVLLWFSISLIISVGIIETFLRNIWRSRHDNYFN